MSERDEDERLATELRSLLSQRDAQAPAPRFTAMWHAQTNERRARPRWQPWLATTAAALVIAGIAWTWLVSHSTRTTAQLDPSLAHQLSSPDYWRVPTDQLLVYEAAPLSADLTVPVGLKVSLEESLL